MDRLKSYLCSVRQIYVSSFGRVEDGMLAYKHDIAPPAALLTSPWGDEASPESSGLLFLEAVRTFTGLL